MTKAAIFFKSKMADGRHFEIIVKSRYLSEKSSDFNEIWYTTLDIEPDDNHMTKQILNQMTVTWPKIEIFKIQDGAGRHLENRCFGHNSSTDCPISAKFCMRKQNGMSTRATWQKLQIFKIRDGGRPPSWKSLNRRISVKNCPISMKFGTLQQMMYPIAVTWPKIEIFEIQDGGDRHLENHFCGHYSSIDFPISAKFCVKQQNCMPTKATS